MQVLQVLPSVTRRIGSELAIDADFCEALEAYMAYFDGVTVACPVGADTADSGLGRCILARDLPWTPHRLKLISLPRAYGVTEFIRSLRATKRIIRAEIEKSEYLVFSPHTLVGDWPTVAVLEAIKLNRRYVIEADVVYEDVAGMGLVGKPWWKKVLKNSVLNPTFLRTYRYSLAHSELAMFQGQDVYDAYARFCKNPHKVYHHIPIYETDHITEEQLVSKASCVKSGAPLKICYAGRAVEMKGPTDWLNTLHSLKMRGVRFVAMWLGDGSLIPEMQARTRQLGIEDCVHLPGFVSNRNQVLDALKASDVFLFCHKTQESARCLGEALACGCPIVGYGSSYARDLVSKFGGGVFASQSDWSRLASILEHLDKNRSDLAALIEQATATGRSFDRKARLRERMELIKEETAGARLPSNAYDRPKSISR